MKAGAASAVLDAIALNGLLAGARSLVVDATDGLTNIRLPSYDKVWAAGETTAAAAGRDPQEERPWKCCNLPITPRVFPPMWRCTDSLDSCPSSCKHCEELEDALAGGYICRDVYRGEDPGPRCTELQGN